MEKSKVVLTGATGYLAGRMLPTLKERYDLTLLDISATNRKTGEPVEDVALVDLTEQDRDVYRSHFQGADAVIHCGYIRTPRGNPDTHFDVELENITMAYNLYHICQEEQIRRIVVFSSNHAADAYEPLLFNGTLGMLSPDLCPYSNQIYGWAKSAYELLGAAFACGRIGGQAVENVQLRIGSPWEIEVRPPKNQHACRRYLGAYLSVQDQTQLVIRSIEAEDMKNERGVPYQVFYGISGNTDRFWSIENAQKIVGYDPEDDCSVRFAEFLENMDDLET